MYVETIGRNCTRTSACISLIRSEIAPAQITSFFFTPTKTKRGGKDGGALLLLDCLDAGKDRTCCGGDGSLCWKGSTGLVLS